MIEKKELRKIIWDKKNKKRKEIADVLSTIYKKYDKEIEELCTQNGGHFWATRVIDNHSVMYPIRFSNFEVCEICNKKGKCLDKDPDEC
jgi:N-formylglutamate amidohydrolase